MSVSNSRHSMRPTKWPKGRLVGSKMKAVTWSQIIESSVSHNIGWCLLCGGRVSSRAVTNPFKRITVASMLKWFEGLRVEAVGVIQVWEGGGLARAVVVRSC